MKPTYQIQTRSSSQILHHNPKLVPLEEACFVLCNKRAGAGGQDRNLLLNLLDIILAGLEIDLRNKRMSIEVIRYPSDEWMHTCFTATISPVVLSIAL